ncbi:MAG: DUF1566 domain-containing protein [Deltaproteobacteria bacterium]|nr:DUF1566 domain-containing protein [Deltaproteobacteria bacterium]
MKRFIPVVAILALFFCFATHGISLGADQSNTTPANNRFVKSGNNIIFDSKTGLEWFVGPDKDITWKKAKYWAEHLTAAGGGWRLPTQQELAVLDDADLNPRRLDPIFKITGWRVWAVDDSDIGSKWFDFLGEYWGDLPESKDSRAFAVRLRK